MPDDSALDPRYPRVFQRGGEGAEVRAPEQRAGFDTQDDIVASHAQSGSTVPREPSARTSAQRAPRAPRGTRAPHAPEVDPDALAPGAAAAPLGRPPLELIVVGNPWMRALWAVGALAFAAGLALAVAAEFGFSAVQSTGPYDPEAFLPPRIAQVLALPFAIAGTVALVAATVLRIVAWRPAAVRELEVD